MHSEGIMAGELKHGPLALIDKDMPVIMIIMKDSCYQKCQNALQQVTARHVIILSLLCNIITELQFMSNMMVNILCVCFRAGQ